MYSLTPYLLVLMLAASLFVILPVLRFRGKDQSQSEIRKQKNIELFQQSLDDLSLNLVDGSMSQEDYEKLKLELEKNFLSDMETQDEAKLKSSSNYTKLVPLLLMLLIPIGSFLFYRSLGSSQELILPSLIEQIGEATTAEEQIETLKVIADVLEDRFRRRNDDLQTAYTLGTLYVSLENYAAAVSVFSTLAEGMEADSDKATVLGQLAQAQYLLADSSMNSAVQASIDEALSLNSNEQAVMSILAVEAILEEDYPAAISFWRRQISQLPVGNPQIAELNQRISAIESFLTDSDSNDAQSSNLAVTVKVEIDESIIDQIDSDMRVFVFARSESVQFPLAAQEFSLSDLPITVTLDDSMAMIPQFTISSVDTIYVGATIARTATADSGGFRAQSSSFVLIEQETPIDLVVKEPIL